MFRILFICDNNSLLSPLAGSIAENNLGSNFLVKTAGIHLAPVHPYVRSVLTESGIEFREKPQIRCEDLNEESFDFVIALTETSRERCGIIPPPSGIQFWDYSSWVKEEELDLLRIRELFSQLRSQIQRFLKEDIFKTFKNLQNFILTFLDNLSEGIIVHDLQRKILIFNQTAEQITGLKRQNVIGRDCHQIFPNGFCGDKCSFKGNTLPERFPVEYPLNVRDKGGVVHFLNVSVTPMFDSNNEMSGVIASIIDKSEEHKLHEKLSGTECFEGIIGEDPKIKGIFGLVNDLSDSTVPVMILGETGTGKEMIARAIHKNSPHSGGLFVPINCGALPREMLGSELFGHVKGAFTGAIRDKKGRFELADGGTLFLDEIGELPLDMQVALLRVLQNGEFERLGSEKTIRVNVRIISATNQNIEMMVKEGNFRDDLFYRLNVVPIQIPPLRERKGDIPLLVEHFLETLGQERKFKISTEALRYLRNYHWPGNIRQLQSAIRYAMITCENSFIDVHNLPDEIVKPLKYNVQKKPGRKKILSKPKVLDALKQAGGNKSKAAKILGVGRATLYRFIDDMDTIDKS